MGGRAMVLRPGRPSPRDPAEPAPHGVEVAGAWRCLPPAAQRSGGDNSHPQAGRFGPPLPFRSSPAAWRGLAAAMVSARPFGESARGRWRITWSSIGRRGRNGPTDGRHRSTARPGTGWHQPCNAPVALATAEADAEQIVQPGRAISTRRRCALRPLSRRLVLCCCATRRSTSCRTWPDHRGVPAMAPDRAREPRGPRTWPPPPAPPGGPTAPRSGGAWLRLVEVQHQDGAAFGSRWPPPPAPLRGSDFGPRRGQRRGSGAGASCLCCGGPSSTAGLAMPRPT
jgi:hypothetical protein